MAAASLAVAAALAFTSLTISEDHDIAAGVCLVIAQFLTLAATILGVDYHFGNHGIINSTRNPQQQPAQYQG